MPADTPPPPSGRLRWWGLAGGIVWAVVDTLLAVALGIAFTVDGRDATWLAVAYFGSSFALLGFLVGYAADARRRDRRAAETIAVIRGRLAQTEKLAALGLLAGAIAHEVRNPLGVMRSAAQGLLERDGPVDEETRRASSFVIAETDRLNAVVTSLLAFARPLQLRRVPVGFAGLLERAERLARQEMPAEGVRLTRRPVAGDSVLYGDPDLLCQVVLGLVANAVAAVDGSGEVVLEGAARNDGVEIAVADSGPGVPAAVRERIFEPFFTSRPAGTGLGLAVARQIVEAHDGTIAVRDRPGGGACFVVQLPLGRGAVGPA